MSNFYLLNNIRLSLLLAVITLLSLQAACGEEARQATVPPATIAAPVVTSATTGAAATAPASASVSSPLASATTSPAATITSSSTAAAATTATTVAAAATTTDAATTAVTTTAPAKAASRPPIGNSYPPGPAPTAAPPAAGLVDVSLQVPEQFRRQSFTTQRTLKLPPGFSISVYSLLENDLRFGAFSPDGRLFVAERGGGRVVLLKDNGVTGEPQSFATGLNGPHGLAFQAVNGQMYLYVAENDKVTRFTYRDGQAQADKKEVVVKSLPAGGGHSTRSIAFGPDGKMYVAAGSSCNVCEESDPRRAAVMQYNADGSGERIYARGLRNEVGIMFYPETGELWGTENSRDDLGRNNEENNSIPPEEINIIIDNGDYGWPYCYSNQLYDSRFGRKNADYCKNTIPPALPMQAHSAPLGLDFYLPKTQLFPADYKGDAFVAFHGSWNRSPATGYKVVRVRVKDGRPASYEDFATGWLTGATSRWGRPVAPIVAPDGSLFLTDDENNAVYHISYKG